VKVTGKIKGKLTNRGEEGFFVGYAKDSAQDTYRMFTPGTKAICCTRDVQWMMRMYYAPEKVAPIQATDSVELITKQGKVPMRTTPKEASIVDLGEIIPDAEKPTVTFQPSSQIEIIPPSQEWIVFFDPDQEEAMSMISKSIGQPWESPDSGRSTQEEPIQDLGRVEEEAELDNDSLFDPQYSDVDSVALEAENEAPQNTSRAETIEEMITQLSEVNHDAQEECEESKAEESISSIVVPRRSGCMR
jgi:hypothetical protein